MVVKTWVNYVSIIDSWVEFATGKIHAFNFEISIQGFRESRNCISDLICLSAHICNNGEPNSACRNVNQQQYHN